MQEEEAEVESANLSLIRLEERDASECLDGGTTETASQLAVPTSPVRQAYFNEHNLRLITQGLADVVTKH